MMKRLEPVLHTDIITVTGQTVGQFAPSKRNRRTNSSLGKIRFNRRWIGRVIWQSWHRKGHSSKRSAISGSASRIEGLARVFNSEEECQTTDNV